MLCMVSLPRPNYLQIPVVLPTCFRQKFGKAGCITHLWWGNAVHGLIAKTKLFANPSCVTYMLSTEIWEGRMHYTSLVGQCCAWSHCQDQIICKSQLCYLHA